MLLPQRTLDTRGKLVDAAQKALVGQLHGLATRERTQTLGQIFCAWHTTAINEHRNDADVPLQCRLDLEPNVIVGVIQAPLTSTICCCQPIWTDDGDKGRAIRDLVVECLHEIDA